VREYLWLPRAVWVALVKCENIFLSGDLVLAVRLKSRDQGNPGTKRLAKAFQVVWLPIIEFVKRPNVQDRFSAGYLLPGAIFLSSGLAQSDILFSVINKAINEHYKPPHIYGDIRTYTYYRIAPKKARPFLAISHVFLLVF
jgi:hypothetical protein